LLCFHFANWLALLLLACALSSFALLCEVLVLLVAWVVVLPWGRTPLGLEVCRQSLSLRGGWACRSSEQNAQLDRLCVSGLQTVLALDLVAVLQLCIAFLCMHSL
jgi:hypothetical protein